MRIIYLATAEIAVESLKALAALDDAEICLVVSQPDRPKGRKRIVQPCPVKQAAIDLGIETFSPEKIGDEESVTKLAALDADLIVVFAYGQYIPSRIIDLPKIDCINIHPSMLPKYRGASPIQSALLNGDEVTGISVIKVGPKMDAGDVYLQKEVRIEPEDNGANLHDRMAREGAEIIRTVIARLKDGSAAATPQDESLVVDCSKFSKEDGRIDWDDRAENVHNKVRAFTPWPGSYCELPEGGDVKIIKTRLVMEEGKPGEIIRVSKSELIVACKDGGLSILELQPAGKKPMSTADFLNGHHLQAGQKFI